MFDSPSLEDLYLRDDSWAIVETARAFEERIKSSPSVSDVFFGGAKDPAITRFWIPWPPPWIRQGWTHMRRL